MTSFTSTARILPFLLFSLCALIDSGSSSDDPTDYSNGPNGPYHWHGDCATGKRQSPIDIAANDVVLSAFEPIQFNNYNNTGDILWVDLGDTIRAQGFEDWGSKRPSVSGGGLSSTYLLKQIHVHWSDSDFVGSEHSINGFHYPMEIHFVHLKEGLTLADAAELPDGLMVVAVFATISVDIHHFQAIISGFKQLANLFINEKINHTLNPGTLLPAETGSFYRYEGSLTTPHCNEAVIWTVLPAPISISPSQLRALRRIRTSLHLDFTSNVRPTQPLNGRKVYFQLNYAHNLIPSRILQPIRASRHPVKTARIASPLDIFY